MTRMNLLLFLILMTGFLGSLLDLTPIPLNNRGYQTSAEGKNYSIDAEEIAIRVIYDNYPFHPGLTTSWGFSCVVKGTEKTILFDTGGDPLTLLNNMKALTIDPDEIDLVVLSHIHGDHIGGLEGLLRRNPKVTVYLPQSFPDYIKECIDGQGAQYLEVREPIEICPDVFSTGELGVGLIEQSLIIQTQKGLIILTGCAHPGIVEIIRAAKNLFKEDVLLVMGGFHLAGNARGSILEIISRFRDLGVHMVGPCHCSGDLSRQLFKEEYGEAYIHIGVGKIIDVNYLPQ